MLGLPNPSQQSAPSNLVGKYTHDPVAYAREVLGISYLWPKMAEIAMALLQPPYKVMVKSGHSCGKTFLAGFLANWFYDTFDPGVVLSTAPNARSVRDLLWKEIRVQRMRAGLSEDFIGDIAPEMRTSQEHYAKGFTATSEAGFQGRHDHRMFFLFDEAAGVPSIYWKTTKTMFKPEAGHAWLVILNPTDTASEAYFEDQSGGWRTFSLSCLDHPNIIAELDDKPVPIPPAVSVSQVNEWIRDWATPIKPAERKQTDFAWPLLKEGQAAEDGKWYRPGPEAESRILGLWPSQAFYNIWSDALFESVCNPDFVPAPKLDEPPHIGCFVAGTLIETEAGQVPIENVMEGDKVLTRLGYKKVKASFCTGIKPTWTLTCEDGRTLTGTGEHPVWDGNQWRRLDSLMSGDMVMIWKESSTTASFSAATQNPNGTGTGGTFSLSSTANRFLSIGTSGRKSTGRFRKAQSSTTRTKTLATTTLAIWSALPHRSIPNITTLSRASSILPSRGTRVKREGFGTVGTANTDGQQLLLSASANTAAFNTLTSHPPHRGSVQTDAKLETGDGADATMRSENARSAARISSVASTNQPKLVPVHVVRNSPGRHARVYNLTVEDCPEYFANGVLVHNCDFARYGDDDTAIHVRWGDRSLWHETHNGWNETQVAGRIVELAREWAELVTDYRRNHDLPPCSPLDVPIKLDDDGCGGGVVTILQEHDMNVVPCRANHLAANQERYPDRRCELWFSTVERAKQGRLSLGKLDKDSLKRLRLELMAPFWWLDSRGRRTVEPKAKTKENLKGHSPDSADALNLSYYEGIQWEAPAIIPVDIQRVNMGSPPSVLDDPRPQERTNKYRRLFGR